MRLMDAVRIYSGLILIFFILAFAVRNIGTYLATGKSIKGKSVQLTISVLLSAAVYGLIIWRLIFPGTRWGAGPGRPDFGVIEITGLIFITAGFILGLLALIEMKNSWRVGIRYDQKTELVTTGIYRFSRNPYFLSYDLLIFGYILIIQSILLVVLYIALVLTFHTMIKEEEIYLQSVHGNAFSDYREKVNRYLTFYR